MSILIGCDSFLSLRNVRNGNLAHHLRDYQLVVLVDPRQYEGAILVAPEGVVVDKLIDFNPHEDPTLKPLIARAYMARKCYYDPSSMWQKLRASSTANNEHRPIRLVASLAKARLRVGGFWVAGLLGCAQTWREDFSRALRAHPVMDQYGRLFERYAPELVVAFSLEGLREMALMEAAHKYGLRTAVMIRSRDNLAAKIQHIPDADAYLVWSQTMADFLYRLFPEFDRRKIHITGSPQFDRHLDPKYRLARDEFFVKMGLNPQRPLVVYSCATPGLIKHEINIAQHLADAVRDRKLAYDAQLLVRGHPRGFGSDHQVLHTVHSDVAVYPAPTRIPYRSAEHEAQVVKLIMEDEPIHLATLAYQDVQVNVSGTMIVDSAIFDKPSIGIYYDIPQNIPPGLSVRRFYKRSDMRSLLRTRGFRLAHLPDDTIDLINRYLENPSLDASGRQVIREIECGPLDGRAGERIAKLFLQLMY